MPRASVSHVFFSVPELQCVVGESNWDGENSVSALCYVGVEEESGPFLERVSEGETQPELR